MAKSKKAPNKIWICDGKIKTHSVRLKLDPIVIITKI